MKHKEKECTWAPGMQQTDVTYAGDHTWATIVRAQKAQAAREGRTGSTGKWLVLAGLAVALAAAGVWLFI